MEWAVALLIGVAAAAVWLWQRSSLVNEEEAHTYLRNGAKVIDVRSEAEYRERHLPEAVNVPLHRLAGEIGGQAPDRATVLLLHCHSGGRSGFGVRTLKRLGYTRAYNLGSYTRAARLIEGTRA